MKAFFDEVSCHSISHHLQQLRISLSDYLSKSTNLFRFSTFTLCLFLLAVDETPDFQLPLDKPSITQKPSQNNFHLEYFCFFSPFRLSSLTIPTLCKQHSRDVVGVEKRKNTQFFMRRQITNNLCPSISSHNDLIAWKLFRRFLFLQQSQLMGNKLN